MSYLVESPQERKARYQRLAIAAAAAAARVPTAEARAAYLILADTWSNLAKDDDAGDAEGTMAPAEPTTQAGPEEPARDSHPGKQS